MYFKLLFVLCFGVFFNTIAQNADIRGEYIQRFKDVAMKEMRRTGVPASIKLAQGILESACGNSALARNANNHFGIKCAPTWKGSTFMQKDDDYDEKGQLRESCFRAYENAEACYIAHSEFLCDPQKIGRYGFLFQLDPSDYKSWAKGLSTAGYATNPSYADALIRIIEECRLYEFDTAQPAAELIEIINDVKMVTARKGQTPEEIADRYHLSAGKILAYNEGFLGAKQALAGGEYVYLERKRGFFRGGIKYHTVQAGDNMFRISQQYGIKLSSLYRKNRMKPGTEPAAGQKIRLRGRVSKKNIPLLRKHVKNEKANSGPTENSSLMDNSREVDPEELQVKKSAGMEKKLSELPGTANDNRSESSETDDQNKPSAKKNNPGPQDDDDTESGTGTIEYTVKAGDTLYAISRRFKMSVAEIKSLNPGLTDSIKVGRVLILVQ